MSFFKLFMRWIWIWMLSWDRLILLLPQLLLKSAALPPIRYSHAGICPNDMNPNLWVDAQSTCGRECDADLLKAYSVMKAKEHSEIMGLRQNIKKSKLLTTDTAISLRNDNEKQIF